jgi:hypothetical protein
MNAICDRMFGLMIISPGMVTQAELKLCRAVERLHERKQLRLEFRLASAFGPTAA